jgi:glutamate dehydrogenase (NAD(P)+)
MDTSNLLPPQIQFDDEPDPLLAAMLDFEEAAEYLDLEPCIVNRLRHSRREVTVNLPLTRDNGEELSVTGFRVQHHCEIGPTLGPVRLSPGADLHQVRAEAMQLSWQMALLDYPFSGAAGAIVCNPQQHSEHELNTITRAYARALLPMIGPHLDVLSPGYGCNEQTMAWMLSGIFESGDVSDWSAKLPQGISPAFGTKLATVVGKPEVLWGLPDAYAGTAMGLCSLLRCAMPGLTGSRMSIQGFDTLGSRIAHGLHAAGAKIIAVADLSGGLYSREGLDLQAVTAHVEHNGVLYGYPGAESVCNAEVLEADCDVLVLAAAPRQISSANAGRVRARLLVEGITGAITRAAENLLAQRDAIVIPNLLANLGASIAACAEWRHNLGLTSANGSLGPEIDDNVRRVYGKVSTAATKENLTLRRAALFLALQRLGKRMRYLGREG